MPRIAGIDLPKEKRTDIGLTLIYGIGRKNVVRILSEAKVDPAKRIMQLSDEELAKINKVMEHFLVEGDLRKRVSQSIQRLKTIGAYRGSRHIKGLPSRGQRTRSNARTKRGKRKTIGALKKEAAAARVTEGSNK
ncbi:MAG: 30S ribosomal protein S13 [Candidatus Shapirobacteria bacterium]|nr:30S ribosomal protein S13 [Candidatus Shapirobacteria bacterium]